MKFFCQTGIRQIAATMILENVEKQNNLSPWRKMLPQYRLLRSKRIVRLQFNQSWDMCYSPRNYERNLVSTKPIIIFCIHLTEKQNLPFRIILLKRLRLVNYNIWGRFLASWQKKQIPQTLQIAKPRLIDLG